MARQLWAKSWDLADQPVPGFVFLPQHLSDVHDAAVAILDATGEDQLMAFQLDPDMWRERFFAVVRLAAVCHDLGKANDHFQGMILKSRERIGRRQGLRHEWVSYWLMEHTELREWLRNALPNEQTRDTDWKAVLWAITGHHPAVNRVCPPPTPADGEGHEMAIFKEQLLRDCISVVEKKMQLGSPVIDVDRFPAQLNCIHVIRTIRKQISRDNAEWDSVHAERDHPGSVGFIAAVKNCVVAADVAGSALPPEDQSEDARRSVIIRGLSNRAAQDDLREIVRDRLTNKTTGKIGELRPFQRAAAEIAGQVSLLKAGCGSGKTLAAYHWAAERCGGRRLYICYPTTGTATEGFRDYVYDEESRVAKVGARLFHGRQEIDEFLILGVEEHDDSESDVLARIESLRAWDTPVVTCTVDTVLGLMANQRRGVYAWPALAGAAFVFDEIHAYDDRLFGKLLRFIGELKGLPILLMTASLPESRLHHLRQVVERSRMSGLVEISGPAELEDLPRYHRELHAEPADILQRVQMELNRTDRPGRVLWVCNTVNRAIAFAEQCEASDLKPMIYHSRFRYRDRVEQHKKVILQFRNDGWPALAICTQVAEMSLDLSATLLVTDQASVPAMIQRLGRLNRRAANVSFPTMPFIVIQPETSGGTLSTMPYSREEFTASTEWLSRLPHRISQRDLVHSWQALTGSEVRERENRSSSWLDGGPCREVTQIRDMQPGINVLLEEDAQVVARHREKLAELVIPMPAPIAANWREWDRCLGVPVVPEGILDYDAHRGGRWRQVEANVESL